MGGQFKFLLKCDDDSFINLKSLSQLLAIYRTMKNFAVGSLIKGVKIDNIPCGNEMVEWYQKFHVWKKVKNKYNNINNITNIINNDNGNNNNYTIGYNMKKCVKSCVFCMKDYMREVGGVDELNDNRLMPAYLSGSAYVLSQEAVRSIVSIVSQYFAFIIEDVFITGIMAQKSHTYLHHSRLFEIQRGISFNACSRQISCHYVDEKGMMKIWNDYLSSSCF